MLFSLKVEGEVSEFKQTTGATYFTLKDDNAQTDCFCYNIKTAFAIGDKIIVDGTPNYYSKTGRLSFYVKAITLKNDIGQLYKKFLELKEKLNKEGLFDQSHKRIVNKYCKKIGVITSESGSVIKDIINVVTRRNPLVDIILYPSRVQGVGAEKELIRGISYFNNSDVDVVIIGRGGGSVEDLSCFNNEDLTRAVYASKKVIISAVGHETDFCLCDFAADLRAPTPSAAAELATIDLSKIKENVIEKINRICVAINKKQEVYINRIRGINKYIISLQNRNIERYVYRIKNADIKINSTLNKKIDSIDFRIDSLIRRIENNNPMKLLRKGIATITKDNKSVENIDELKVGDIIKAQMLNGDFYATVNEVKFEKQQHISDKL
ncbi:MAG: exodeoxyribonuclease VII large subunit [Clostridia bacterium]